MPTGLNFMLQSVASCLCLLITLILLYQIRVMRRSVRNGSRHATKKLILPIYHYIIILLSIPYLLNSIKDIMLFITQVKFMNQNTIHCRRMYHTITIVINAFTTAWERFIFDGTAIFLMRCIIDSPYPPLTSHSSSKKIFYTLPFDFTLPKVK